MNNYVSAKAKVLSKNEEDYTIGFKCPKCASGMVTTSFSTKDEIQIGSLIDVKIAEVTLTDGNVTDIKLWNEDNDIGNMPDITAQLKEMGHLIEVTTSPVSGNDNSLETNAITAVGKYMIKEQLSDKLYKIEDTEKKENFIGLAKEELKIDTLATEDDFERIAAEHPMADFSLIKHWWGDGETFKHYDLFMFDGQNTCHMVFQVSPQKEFELKAIQRVPYSEDFWTRGEEMELINPGDPGNPSNDVCAIERIDIGKMAIYESFLDDNNKYHLRVEFLGSILEGRWYFTSSVQNVWHATKETMRLSEKFPMELRLQGDIGGFEETPEGLKVTGTALSFGVWNGFYFSPEVITESPVDDFKNMIVDQEHKRGEVAGVVAKYEQKGPDIWVETMITDYEAIEKVKRGEYKGFSIDANVYADPVRRMITGVKDYQRLTICANPACKTCYFGM